MGSAQPTPPLARPGASIPFVRNDQPRQDKMAALEYPQVWKRETTRAPPALQGSNKTKSSLGQLIIGFLLRQSQQSQASGRCKRDDIQRSCMCARIKGKIRCSCLLKPASLLHVNPSFFNSLAKRKKYQKVPVLFKRFRQLQQNPQVSLPTDGAWRSAAIYVAKDCGSAWLLARDDLEGTGSSGSSKMHISSSRPGCGTTD